MNVQHKAAILIYVRFSLVQRPYACAIALSQSPLVKATVHEMHSIAQINMATLYWTFIGSAVLCYAFAAYVILYAIALILEKYCIQKFYNVL